MPLVEFEPTVPVFERAKTVHDLVRAATVIGEVEDRVTKYYNVDKMRGDEMDGTSSMNEGQDKCV
jgi:hypothetical protein